MLISLGYSCQTRFMIDALTPDQKRQPFDFIITSRAALIRALATDGASLMHRAEDALPYRMPGELREGIGASGLYFWHDYPLQDDKLSLHADWREKVAEVNAKYAYLWKRFSELVHSDMEKTFVLCNTQKNLTEFAADDADFTQKFGLGRQAFEEIAAALGGYGARNYRLKFISRSRDEVAETAGIAGDGLDHRFAGPLRLRPDPEIVAELFG
jgi:hypothetical protein